VAVDGVGNVYVADSNNHTIRKVTRAGVVTTLAGSPLNSGSANGTGAMARFNYPYSVAVDSAGNVYVADTSNHTIRKVTPAGVVTTLAGLASNSGSANGTGSAARFHSPTGVGVDSAGNVYVADTSNHTIRKVTPAGVVTTLAGLALSSGADDGIGSAARFNSPYGVAVDSAGRVYVAEYFNHSIRVGGVACPDAPTIDLATGPVGQLRQLDTSPQNAIAWQWRLIRAPSASSASLSAANVRNPSFKPDVADLFIFRLQATNATGAISIRTLTFTAVPPPPAIVTPPLTQTVELGCGASFQVEVTNAVPGTACQWFLNGSPLAGATNTCLSLANILATQGGSYTVVVSNAYGSATSAPALLSVVPVVPRRTVPALNLAGDVGSSLHVEYADALAPSPTWQALGVITLTNLPQLCLDLSVPMPPHRFYRAWQGNQPSLPPAVYLGGMATEITLTGDIGDKVRVDYINQIGPTDAWVTLDTITLRNPTQCYYDLTMWQQPPRVYRLVPVP